MKLTVPKSRVGGVYTNLLMRIRLSRLTVTLVVQPELQKC